MSYVLEDAQVKEQNGLVQHDRLGKIWDHPDRPETERYPSELHPVFLKLMSRFDLSYQIAMPEVDAPATSLIAQLVPGGRPQGWEEDWASEPPEGDSERTQRSTGRRLLVPSWMSVVTCNGVESFPSCTTGPPRTGQIEISRSLPSAIRSVGAARTIHTSSPSATSTQ